MSSCQKIPEDVKDVFRIFGFVKPYQTMWKKEVRIDG